MFETLTGALLGEVEPAELSWEVQSNTAETVNASFQLDGTTDMRGLLSEWKHSLAVDVGGRVLGGPIMPHEFDGDSGVLRVTARGLRVLFAHRTVMPVAVLTEPATIDGQPNPAIDSLFTGMDLGTIASRIGQQACEWPGSSYPITWPADRAGSRERTYLGVDRKKVDEAWSDISDVENGPDIRLSLGWDGPDGFRWTFEVGTEAQPRLESEQVHPWEPAQGSGLSVSTDPSKMGSVSWSAGGRSDDTTVIDMLYDPALVDEGYPLLEVESDASSSVSDPATLRAWNVERLRTAGRPWEFWTFKVRMTSPPFPFEFNCGDLCDVFVTENTPVAGGYVPASPEPYRRRIVGLSGSADSEWISVTCGAVF